LHLRLFLQLAEAFADLDGETLVIEGLPGYDELKADGIGKWLN
jgi:anthranilate phosphoribosyltransferase